MGMALDAIAGLRTTGGGGADAAFNAVVVAPGDSTTIRNFVPPATCSLDGMLSSAAAAPLGVRIRSPLLHDAVEGIQYIPGTTITNQVLPHQIQQKFRPQDVLTFEIKGSGVAAANVAVILLNYSDLPGVGARLHMPADVMNLVKNIKILQVTMAAGGAIGQWEDTALTVTENLLHANTDYAVLGYIVDVARTAVGFKGIDSGNLRVVGPGVVDQKVTTDYFIKKSLDTGLPHIPVFNAANASSAYATAVSHTAPDAANVQLICAELGQNLS